MPCSGGILITFSLQSKQLQPNRPMAYDPAIHHRRSIRLPAHDYAAGGIYYVTLCTAGRRRLFGTVVNGRMALNEAGRAVRDEWLRSAAIRAEIALDEWVVMPDHFHAVVMIRGGGGDRPVAPTAAGPAPKSLGALMAGFKCASAKRINEWHRTPGAPVWHRNYYEHIVQNAADLDRIRAYIRENPANNDVLRFGEPRFMAGNRALLALPKTAFLASRAVRATGRSPQTVAPPTEWATSRSPLRQFPSPPACIISGFLSPLERAVFDEGLAAAIPMIWVLACGLPGTFPPRLQSAIDAGRLLAITPFDTVVAAISAQRAAWCSQYVLHAADTVVIGHLAPDGMLACLLTDLPADRPLHILHRTGDRPVAPNGRPPDGKGDRPVARTAGLPSGGSE